MNLNGNPESLKNEEQKILEQLIRKMDKEIKSLDQRLRGYVKEAKNADISVNPDTYLAKVLAQKGLRDTKENRNKVLRARDELYENRLLLELEESDGKDIQEYKVGLQGIGDKGNRLIVNWEMPVCRHFILNQDTSEFTHVHVESDGSTRETKYRLLVRNKVDLRFTHVMKALNLFPGLIDEETLKKIRESGFLSNAFLDKIIAEFDPNTYDAETASQIIADEFLLELLERRSNPEFKNIVFSIQKKQGEIIQSAYDRNMIVQGCAGSGKSMIMMHRLPIVLYDNPKTLNRKNTYIITPSPMYIQMAESMRHQLKISDIGMGTIEQYFDICIGKYPGHKPGEYGKVSYHLPITSEQERYAYSTECINDIKEAFENICQVNNDMLEQAAAVLNIYYDAITIGDRYDHKLNGNIHYLQKIINENSAVINTYYKTMLETVNDLYTLSATLLGRKREILSVINKKIPKYQNVIDTAKKDITTFDPVKSSKAIGRRKLIIKEAQSKIDSLKQELKAVEEDQVYFEFLTKSGEEIKKQIQGFSRLKGTLHLFTIQETYEIIKDVDILSTELATAIENLRTIEDKYLDYVSPIYKEEQKLQKDYISLQALLKPYLDYDLFMRIRELEKHSNDMNSTVIQNVYENIMGKLGIQRTEKGNLKALVCSPYIYLQVLFQFHGAPNTARESLLCIDEAQGIAPEELRLLRGVNGRNLILNMYGDVYQHIEGTKGIDNWKEFNDILEYDLYEMNENYRNASQITEYCNSVFENMHMKAINTPGKGVHVIQTEREFRSEMLTQLLDTQRTGLAAILIGDDAESAYLLDQFERDSDKFHDMTGEEFSLHRTRWNIIRIYDAKGLEFSSVIVLAGRMTTHEKYIAFTRALDELFVYPLKIDISEYDKKRSKQGKSKENNHDISPSREIQSSPNKVTKGHSKSAVRDFFEEKGLEVLDKRDDGGRLWVIGEKNAIRDVVNAAISKFEISGKYMICKESRNRNGWCTKTDK